MEKQQEVKTITCFSQFEKEKENLDSSPFIATFFEYLSESDEELLSILFFKNTFHFIYSFFFFKKILLDSINENDNVVLFISCNWYQSTKAFKLYQLSKRFPNVHFFEYQFVFF